jgi:hypothetical protein
MTHKRVVEFTPEETLKMLECSIGVIVTRIDSILPKYDIDRGLYLEFTYTIDETPTKT